VSPSQRPVPPPFEGDDRFITATITAGFAVALIVLLIIRNQLAAADRWWIWVAVGGLCLGLFGLVYVPFLKRSRSRAAERRSRPAPRPDDAAEGNGKLTGSARQNADQE
jgi:hypothetical protein